MKKQILGISKIATWAVALAYVFCCISAVETYAQKAKPASKPKEVWYLTFDVTIKGSGKKETGKDLVESWVINRTYSGTIELNYPSPTSVYVNKSMTPAEITARTNAAPVLWSHYGKDFDSYMLVKVKIHDFFMTFLKGKYEGRSFEHSTHEVSWEGEGTALANGTPQLLIDTNKSNYNVTIPLNLLTKDLNLAKITRHMIDRSDFGFGDAPPHEQTESEPEYLPLGTFGFPKVIALLKEGIIHHPAGDKPLELIKGGYEWDSGDREIDEPILKGFPESRKGIYVHIYYFFKKMTAN